MIDARLLTTERLETDVCIVGAGPAGITLARELIGQGIDVLLLESGGREFDPEIQSLADGHVTGDSVVRPVTACHRQLGGTANTWHINIREGELGLRLAPFDEIDFEQRDWVPNSGWPFNRNHLTPYYERAQTVCKAGPFRYDADNWEGDQRRRLPLNGQILETQTFQFSPSAVFHAQYLAELEAAPNIKIVTHATAVELITVDAGSAVNEVRVACLTGKQFHVAAKMFVLACGAFENARLLLMSNRQRSAGLGNEHDVVGRYYHDHPEVISGYLVPHDQAFFNNIALYDIREINNTPVMGFLRLTRDTLVQEKLLNSCTMLFPRLSRRGIEAIEAARYLRNNLMTSPKEAPRKLLQTAKGLDVIARAIYYSQAKKQSLHPYLSHDGWRDTLDNGKIYQRIEVRHGIEQSPSPDNRVSLSGDRDALGARKLELHSRLQRSDAEQFARSINLIAAELGNSGLGEFQPELNDEGLPEPIRPIGSHHLMGTTRMQNDPRKGVVDAQCRVHGISNLFVAGSSTFPTGGYANPTLTIIAMSLRLADFVKSRFHHHAYSA